MPTLSVVGTGTMVSDGLSMINAEFSSSSFRVVPAVIGTRNFLGNGIAYPAGRPDRRQLPAGHQGHDPGRRAGPGGRRPARLALLRDPPLGQPGPPVRPPEHAAPTGGAGSGQEPAQRRHDGLHLLVRWLYLTGIALVVDAATAAVERALAW